LAVLRGQSLVPDQIVWEWVEYQQAFNDLLTRFSALLARNAKAEKARAVRDLPESSPDLRQPAHVSHKAELRSRAAALRGLPSRQLDLVVGGDPPPPPPEPEKP